MDKFGMNSQTEHLQAKYVGTGNADMTKYEWLTNQHRDTLSYIVCDTGLSTFMSVIENESISRIKFNCLQKMLQPCGPPPPLTDYEKQLEKLEQAREE